MKNFLSIPEISTNPIMPKVAMQLMEPGSHAMSAKSFVNILSVLSPRNELAKKKECKYFVRKGVDHYETILGEHAQ